MKRSKVLDIMNITQEQFEQIKKEISFNAETRVFCDGKTEIFLLKTKRKTYQFIYTYGDKPFTECFKDMVKIAYGC